MNSKSHTNGASEAKAAFSLHELLVVIAFIGLLSVVVLPALASSKPASRALQCLENQRRMMLAWRLYSNDFSDKLPRNGGIGDIATSMANIPLLLNGNWVHGMMGNQYGATPVSNTDPNLVRAGSLFPYAKDLNMYKCPEDKKTALISGVEVPTTRSIAMNGWLNPIVAWSTSLRLYRTQSSITNPAPADLWVIIDESPATIDDGYFACDPLGYPTTWIERPASYHAGGSGISFADGHSIIRKWTDPVVLSDAAARFTVAGQNPPSDLNWLHVRSTSLP